MDFLSRLPDLAQTEVLIHIESEASIMKLIRVSSSMFRHYTSYRQSIMRGILENILIVDTTGSILQDAMTIMSLPPMETSPYPSIRNVIQQRVAQDFPDSLKDLEPATVRKLYRLFSRIISFIEDYLSKALDPFPPRAYMALPELASNNNGMRFKGRLVKDVKPMLFSLLTTSERSRFLLAFLRHELLCKAYDTRYWETNEPRRQSGMANLVKELHTDLPLEDLRAIYCAHEYYKSLCGAIAAQLYDAWLPERPSCPLFGPLSSAHNPGKFDLRHPDNLYFDSKKYLKDLDYRFESVAYVLPCFGLDVFTSMLISMARSPDGGKSVRDLLYTIAKQAGLPGFERWRFNLGAVRVTNDLSNFRSLAESDPSISAWELRPDLQGRPISRHPVWYEFIDRHALHSLQVKIFRQRAWGMLDNDRLYSNIKSHLPSTKDLERLSFGDVAMNSSKDAENDRSRLRSQQWQDHWSGRSSVKPPLVPPLVEGQIWEGNCNHLPRFFETPEPGKMPLFWRRRPFMDWR